METFFVAWWRGAEASGGSHPAANKTVFQSTVRRVWKSLSYVYTLMVPARRRPIVHSMAQRESWFRRFSNAVSCAVGTHWAFLIAFGVVLAWMITGPLFHFSDSWQLVINTGTTIVTF